MKKNLPLIITLLLVCAILSGVMLHCTKVITDKLDAVRSGLTGEISTLRQSVEEMEASLSGGNEEEVLVIGDAARYLCVDIDTLRDMIASGALEGTYLEPTDGTYLFIREKLYQWCLDQVE